MTTLLHKVNSTALAHSLIPSNLLSFAYSLIPSICSHLLAHSLAQSHICSLMLSHPSCALASSLTCSLNILLLAHAFKSLSFSHLLTPSNSFSLAYSLIPQTTSHLLNHLFHQTDLHLSALSFHQSCSYFPTYSVL
jgi:hypothetical protein